jgi:hypothetical protein
MDSKSFFDETEKTSREIMIIFLVEDYLQCFLMSPFLKFQLKNRYRKFNGDEM